MTTSTESATRCPELEDLAAFVDGRLEGESREAVVEHLASCESCYDVYAETLRVRDDLDPQVTSLEDGADSAPDELAPVIRHPRSFGWARPWAAALAAMVILGFGIRLFWSQAHPPSSGVLIGDPSRWLSSSPFPDKWYEHSWSVKRGVAPQLSASERDAASTAFRLGVHVLDLELALRTEDSDTAKEQVQHIEQRLESIEFSQPWSAAYRDLREQLRSGTSPEAVLETAAELERDLIQGDVPLVDPTYFSFGQWTEAARLAAMIGYSEHFQKREFRKMLRAFLKKSFSDNVVQELRKIESLYEAGPSAGLSQALDRLIFLEGVK